MIDQKALEKFQDYSFRPDEDLLIDQLEKLRELSEDKDSLDGSKLRKQEQDIIAKHHGGHMVINQLEGHKNKSVYDKKIIEETKELQSETTIVNLHNNTDAPLEPPVAKFQEYKVRQSDVHKKQMFKSILK